MQNLRSTFRTRTEEQAMACNRQQHPSEGQKNQLPDTLLKTEVKSLATSPVSYFYHFLKLLEHVRLQPRTVFPGSNLHNAVLHTPKRSYTKSPRFLVSGGIQHSTQPLFRWVLPCSLPSVWAATPAYTMWDAEHCLKQQVYLQSEFCKDIFRPNHTPFTDRHSILPFRGRRMDLCFRYRFQTQALFLPPQRLAIWS